jgi:hypothetical protein
MFRIMVESAARYRTRIARLAYMPSDHGLFVPNYRRSWAIGYRPS